MPPATSPSLPLLRLAAACGALALFSCEEPQPPPEPACNGAPALCARRFDEVSFACSHNAMSNAEEGWEAPNQNLPLRRQLEDGVRALMLDTHYWEGVPHLCHGPCGLGMKPLVEGLAEIRSFLEEHPREVVSLLFEPYIEAEDTEAAIAAAGLLPMVHTQVRGTPWPTLGAMVESGRRLVVFTERSGGPAPWHHALYAFAFETHYAFRTAAEMDCSPHRGSDSNDLFLLNHFLTNPLASPAFAEEVNRNPFLAERAARCARERNRLPNFVAVDFHDIGDVVAVVRALNGL